MIVKKVTISNYVYSKNKGAAFSKPKSDNFLKQNSIDEIFIVDLNASACVLKTSIGAKNIGYRNLYSISTYPTYLYLKCRVV
ncbi:cysteine hydrolase [Clostridium tagluense]|nr:cysteine hydrolase [Clostridium tagluense]